MRGRKRKEIEGIQDYDFEQLYKRASHPRERMRYLAFAHIKDGKSFTETACMLKVNVRNLMKWVERFRRHRVEGLKEQPGRGAKLRLSPEHYPALREGVEQLQRQLPGGRIRGSDIRIWIKERWGVELVGTTLYDTLKRARVVWITGRSQHPHSQVEIQEDFKKNSLRS